MIVPSLDQYLELTKKSGAVPITADTLADLETPLSAYWKLAHDQSESFLLESVTGGEHLARYSIIGTKPRATLRSKNNRVNLRTESSHDHFSDEPNSDPLARIQHLIRFIDPKLAEGLPQLCGGAVGLVSYDYVRTIEQIPNSNPDDLEIDDVALMICDSVVVFDHAKNLIKIIVIADGTEDSYRQAIEEIKWIQSRLAAPLPPLPHSTEPPTPVQCNTTAEEFEQTVNTIIDYIKAGDGIQMVPSIRFSQEIKAHPLTIYRALRSLNPSPFMYLLRFEDLDIVGASPELLTGLENRKATVRPIAGTRPRGETPTEDKVLADELLADEKERAEHVMLVDLGRNDLGRVCQYGTVTVEHLMQIERYSHVMHIVSDVHGTLQDDLGAIDLLRATFPAGTLSGAPKVRAMQIIEEVEKTRRGVYGGAVGFFSSQGDMELAIAIRTIVLKQGVAYVQAGAGIVFDSDPKKEYDECCNKARAALRALEIAQTGL